MEIKDYVAKSIMDAFAAADEQIKIYDEIPVQGTAQPYCVITVLEEPEVLRSSTLHYQLSWRNTMLEVRYAEDIDGPGYTKAYERVAPLFRQALSMIMVPLGKDGELRPLKPRGRLMKKTVDNILVYVVGYTTLVYDYTQVEMTEQLETSIVNSEEN